MAAMVFSFSIGLDAQNDVKVSIQGTLKDANSTAVDDGEYDVIFKLYNSDNGGSAVWEETSTVLVEGGVYSHKLGSVTPLEESDFTETLYLGVTVNSVELSPRTELTYAPYTLSTGYAARSGNGVPPGSLMPFAGPLASVPDGYMFCKGQALSSSDYPDLYDAIGKAWGNGSTGEGSGANTDFNLPDSRGMFLRGWANGSTNDPDRGDRERSATGGNTGDAVGTTQDDEFKSHKHSLSESGEHDHNIPTGGAHSHTINADFAEGVNSGGGTDYVLKNADGGGATTEETSTDGSHTHTMDKAGKHTHTVGNAGGSETRSKNIAVLYIIKI